MKFIRFPLCFTALTLVFAPPALAADGTVLAKKPAPVVREAKRLEPAEPRPGDVQYADQPGQLVYQVLLAEIALQRGDAVLASKAYADLALRTRDSKVLERTVEVAGYAHRFDLALEAARLWVELEPESKRAQQLVVSAMILSNQLDELAPNLVRMLEVDKASLGENLLGLNRMFARNTDRQAVFHLIDQVCRPFFGVAEAHYSLAMAASSAGLHERALAEIRRALELRSDWEMAALLQIQLLSRESADQALSFMQGFLERYPKARDVQLTLARALLGEKRYAEAKHHFDQLLRDYPDSPEVVYPAALLALQQNDRDFAQAQLQHLLTLNIPDKSLAYYYLGQIAEGDKRSEEAIAHYARVGAGEHYLPAQFRRAHLLADQGKLDAARSQLREAKARTPEERVQLVIAEAALLREAKQTQAAFDLLEQTLGGQPEQPDLLYESALLAEKLGRMDILESRLRKLIELRPDSAQAYNALGYSYAERNLRLPEARELIEKALKLAPEDTFILDSLGWVLYRQGDPLAALSQLERAYAQRDDPEIAAHLGEVLSALGRTDDARHILHEAMHKYPGNEALIDAVRKFAP
ncbi:tetratricopeptide repeat protein [Propionivibrio sp.]|uniref:tetratricopeptide repeat protein n=1 Tax=Propionivibrio sp. TaxID=2212460 RepID=UPI002617A0C2|nr:tetratricopeptide repeat protein [Propionivibrio sp.]